MKIDINSVIGFLEKTENLIVPEGIQFSSFEILFETALRYKWAEVPSKEKIISTWDLIKDEIFLSKKKEEAKSYYSQLSFLLRNELLPDYKILNAAIGIYPEATKIKYSQIVESFRNEYYRISTEIDNAKTIEELKNINENFQRTI